MQESSIQSEAVVKTQKSQELPYYKLLCAVEREINKIRQLKEQKSTCQNSEIVKIQELSPTQETIISEIKSQQSAFKPFIKEEFDDLFNEESSQQSVPLKMVNTKSIKNQFFNFFRTLKRNSSFSHLIPINTIVLAKIDDQLIWPVKIIEMNEIQFNSLQRTRKSSIKQMLSIEIDLFSQFSPQNRERLRKFDNDKKLLKSLKLAEKICQQNENSAIKFQKSRFQDKAKEKKLPTAKIVRNIVLQGYKSEYFKRQNLSTLKKIESFISKISRNCQHSQKWQPLNLIIETPKIDPQYLKKESQLNFDQLIKQDAEEDFIKKAFQDDQTYFIEQEKKLTLENQDFDQKSYSENKFLLSKITRYLHDYKKQLQNIHRKRQKKIKSDQVFILFNVSLEKFKKWDVSKYSQIIYDSIEICQTKPSKLNDNDIAFIHGIKQSICLIYRYLKDYKGQNIFVKVLKSSSFLKLKKFFEEVQKNIKEQN